MRYQVFCFHILVHHRARRKTSKSHLGALGAMVSLEKSAKKVTVTQTTNKTTWDEETWTSSEMKTKNNPDQKPTNCESYGSLNSPEKQQRPVPTPVQRKERDKNQICKRASTNTCNKTKTSNLSSRIYTKLISKKTKSLIFFVAKRITSKFAALASSPLEFSKKKLLYISLWLSISSHTW